ncbi:hypothetical protein LTR36_010693 [Oleoguttula mirabilis]|uniref:Uncharacterized protein n=1 Tax=Oleoguttula mirabilis TaxID=1507867 RepID=A0AAV9JR90_9PEZI|nr:hypothetical protein LTR36_010693 [Oleoguttula mirabilis]
MDHSDPLSSATCVHCSMLTRPIFLLVLLATVDSCMPLDFTTTGPQYFYQHRRASCNESDNYMAALSQSIASTRANISLDIPDLRLHHGLMAHFHPEGRDSSFCAQARRALTGDMEIWCDLSAEFVQQAEKLQVMHRRRCKNEVMVVTMDGRFEREYAVAFRRVDDVVDTMRVAAGNMHRAIESAVRVCRPAKRDAETAVSLE